MTASDSFVYISYLLKQMNKQKKTKQPDMLDMLDQLLSIPKGFSCCSYLKL